MNSIELDDEYTDPEVDFVQQHMVKRQANAQVAVLRDDLVHLLHQILQNQKVNEPKIIEIIELLLIIKRECGLLSNSINSLLNMTGKIDGKIQSLLPEKEYAPYPRPVGRPRKYLVKATHPIRDNIVITNLILELELKPGYYRIKEIVRLIIGSDWSEEQFQELSKEFSAKGMGKALRSLGFKVKKDMQGFIYHPPVGWNKKRIELLTAIDS